MSYDLYFVRVAAGQDPAAVAEAALAAEEDGINPGPIDPAIDDRKRAIAAALIQVDPTLRISAFEFAEIAALQGVSETEARRANRHLELDAGLESRTGIQITLFDDTAALTVPYWHHDAAMREVWSEIWKYVGVLKYAGHYVAYDPQIERTVDQARDADAVLASYAGGVTFTDGVAKDLTHGLPARPWWKFWSRGA